MTYPLYWLDQMREQFPDFEDWPKIDAYFDELVTRNIDILLARNESLRKAKRYKTFRAPGGQ